jgi:CheY-like chemotaxis protein
VDARPIEFEVANLFAALRGMLRPLLLNQSVDLVFEDAGAVPPLFTDEGKISQILRNFISNALKFTERGEVRVSARVIGDDEVALSVCDTGIGIAPEDVDSIFQDFVQIDHPIQRRVKGTGLGLPLSKKLAVFLGGSVEVESTPGEGSTFTLRIPCHFPEAARALATAAPVWVPDASGLPVLIVEDDADTILTYQSYLRDSGFRPVCAATTREAEKLLEQMEPCAIVLDIVLRSEDTWSLLASLKQDPRTKGIPIIMASTVEDQAKSYHLGADAYLVKPIEQAEMLKQLRALTGDPGLSRVLIIDDNDVDRYLLRQRLKNMPVAIAEETGGMAGIRKAAETRPDLIFLDLTMPDMTGYEVLDELKRQPETGGIPVVVVTSRTLLESERERLIAQCVTIIGKDNVNDTTVGDAIRSTLKKTAAEAK